jgi:ABC-type multidrug transport system fused ATPase/permease subunit
MESENDSSEDTDASDFERRDQRSKPMQLLPSAARGCDSVTEEEEEVQSAEERLTSAEKHEKMRGNSERAQAGRHKVPSEVVTTTGYEPANATNSSVEAAAASSTAQNADQVERETSSTARSTEDASFSDDEPPTYVPRNFAAAMTKRNRESGASSLPAPLDTEPDQRISLDDYVRVRRYRPEASNEDKLKLPIRERSGLSNQSAQPESGTSSSALHSIGRRVANFFPQPVTSTTRDVLDSFKQLIWERPLIAPSQSSIFWEYYANAVYGIYPDGPRYAPTSMKSSIDKIGATEAVLKGKSVPASTMDDAVPDEAKSPDESSRQGYRRFCGLCYCCGFSLCACTADPEVDRRNYAELQSIANLLSPRQWFMNGAFSIFRGFIAAFATGGVFPAYLYLFGHVVDYWSNIYFGVVTGDPRSSLHHYLIGFGVVSAVAVTSLFFQSRFLGALGRQVRYRLRLWSFAALLQTTGVNTDRLDRYLFEQNNLEQMEVLVYDAVEHFTASLNYTAQILACFIIGMTESWFLTLVLLGTTPFLAALGLLQLFSTRAAARRYEQARCDTREFLSNTRAALPNIVLYDQFQKEFQKLYELTDTERKCDSTLNVIQSLLRGLTLGFVLALFAVLGIYLGGHLVRTKHRSSGRLVAAILLSVLLIASILKLTENILHYLSAKRRLAAFLDFVLDVVDESQSGLGSVLRVDERNVRIVFRDVSVTDDENDRNGPLEANLSPQTEHWRTDAHAAVPYRHAASITSGGGQDDPPAEAYPAQRADVFGRSGHGIGSCYAQYIFLSLSFAIEHHQTHCFIVRKRKEERLLLELFSGKRHPDSGEIFFGEHRLQDYTTAALTTAIGLVPWRGSRLIPGSTIFENIAYGSTGASFTEVRNAASLVGMHEAILQLPNGYQTLVPSSNAAYGLFSQAQLQALSLARVLLRNPSLLLIDSDTYVSLLEMTMNGLALDLKSICRGRTVAFVIRANLVESLYFADTISVIEEGRVVEQGPHHILLERSHGIYAQLVRSNMAREADLDDLNISEEEIA